MRSFSGLHVVVHSRPRDKRVHRTHSHRQNMESDELIRRVSEERHIGPGVFPVPNVSLE